MPARLAALVALALSVPLTAEPLAERPRPMRFERLTIEDGLSQSTVNCILQDSTGFLWLGTQNGLNRYDGYGFTVYRHDDEDPTSLPYDWVQALLEDPSGDLWIATEGGGLARWRRASDTFLGYRHDPADPGSLSGDMAIDLARDGEGSLWIGTRDAGLNRLDVATGRFERFRHQPSDPASLPSDVIRTLYVDRAGELWAGTAGGLARFDRRRRAFASYRHEPADPGSLSDNRVRAILEDREGRLWVGSHGGLNRLDTASGRFERWLHDPHDSGSLSHDWVRSLFEDADGRLWVGTDGGLNLWRPDSDRFVAYRHDPGDAKSLGGDHIIAIYQDRSGVLWLAPVGAGVNRWNPGTWSFPLYTSDGGTGSSNMVLAISEDSEGGLWTGSFGGGVERLDRATGRRLRYVHDPGDDSGLSDDRVTALLHDRAGALWIGTMAGGLNRLAAGSFAHFRHDPADPGSLSTDAVTTLFEDRRGRLWIGTFGGGLNLLQGDGTFTRFQHDPADPTSLGDDVVFSLAAGVSGLWVATESGGLSRLNPASGTFLRVRHDPLRAGSLASDELLAVHRDPVGRLWVGTKGSGLDRLDRLDETSGQADFVHYSRQQGLPDDTVWGLRSDPGGNLWIATNHGLARLDPRTETFTHYTTGHGLQSNEFNLGAHFASPSGELFFGGVGGLNAFFADRIRPNATVPPVVVTSFSKLNQEVGFGRPIFDVDRIRLGHRDYYFSLEIAALDFTAPHENRYRYKLEGFDTDWVELGSRRRLTFTNLDAGRYTLRLQGSNNDGVWNREGATLEIEVAPPAWQTWWAISLYMLVLAAAVGGLVRHQRQQVELERAATRHQRRIAERERAQAEERRQLLEQRETLIQNLEAKNAELERFNYTLSHDLKSPLVTIKGFVGLLQQDAADGNLERLNQDARRIAAAADRMHRLLEELLELSRLGLQARPFEQVSLVDLAREALEIVAGDFAAGKVEAKIDPDLPSVFGDRVRLLQLYQNLLVNAAKYMGDQSCPRVEIGARPGEPPAGESRVLFVRDNGIGIDEAYHEKVFGLFERLDAAEEGTGIGLALVKRIVEMHGGSIWVESEGAGRGSTFCFTVADTQLEGPEQPDDVGRVVDAVGRFGRSSKAV